MSCSDVSFQLRMLSTSAASKDINQDLWHTFYVEVVAVADSRLEEDTDAEGQLVGQFLVFEVLVD